MYMGHVHRETKKRWRQQEASERKSVARVKEDIC
jgi:hypothetical protein